ncbi:cyclic nucleotide-binding domain-containing protein 2-like isoform X2 [Xenia sp. Carnegie-2017]|nr:cyclic nucleotide-binding domain-containing protein 2-like isoform X2 [Xenia sp. Carnegie-2017]XP_046853522.1 cyclic nucleotide-binding domain-containing protein 2-like isoform X2 [Xenia sp. Carnegie-2017]XP_046853523.1 cyclic nucleotide-binding domain-containing protein 2-like isoform X2 [Xenia sp. Carnegie-2017]
MNANNVSEEVRLEDDGTKSPLFDPAWFKANREIRLSSETKAILCQDPNTRTREQVQTVFRSLQTLCSFGEYPLYHQKAMCQNATYQSYPKNATIIQQGHRAENFYFILSGSAKSISKHPVNGIGDRASESVSVMKRGMSFGEAEIMNDTLRTVTVTSKTPIELLVISKEDYAKIFFGAMSETGRKSYIAFLRTVEFLKDWPVDMLESQPEQSQHCYFKRGCVIVQNSNNSPWLYIIKSGVCEVLIQLKSVKPRKAVGRNVRELTSLEALTKITLERRQEMRKREKDKKEQRQKTLEKRQRRITLCHVPEGKFSTSVRHEDVFLRRMHVSAPAIIDKSISAKHARKYMPRLDNNTTSLSRMSKTVRSIGGSSESYHTSMGRTRSFSLPSTSIASDFKRRSNKKPAFVQVDQLHSKMVFGLSELDFEYNSLHSGDPVNVSLVSRGAECVMISKKFFMEHANAFTKRWIRLNVQPYLPIERHQQTLQENIDWDAFKKKLVLGIVTRNIKLK